ncbi:MAG: hypothetical protein R2912_11085 [Eubacteriales bacterium]
MSSVSLSESGPSKSVNVYFIRHSHNIACHQLLMRQSELLCAFDDLACAVLVRFGIEEEE